MTGLRGLLGLALLLAVARAETVHLKDGQRLVGELVEETPEELVLRTRYGVLVLPLAAVERIEGRPAEEARPAEPPPLDLARTRLLHLKARRQLQTGKSADALATWSELLQVDPDDAIAHLELGLLHAREGRPAEAVSALRRAILAGWCDVERLRRDPDLAGLRGQAAFEQLLTQRAGLLRMAARRTPARLVRELRARGAQAAYRAVPDEALGVIWLHAVPDAAGEAGAAAEAALAATRAGIAAVISAARSDPFTAPPAGPLFLVLLAERDRGVLPEVSASWDPVAHTVITRPLPGGEVGRAPATQRALLRALHALDQQARQQQHPAWLGEALVDLLGTAALEGGRLVPRHGARLAAWRDGLAPAAVEGDWGPLRGGADGPATPEAAQLARCLLHHLASRGALGRFYERFGRAREQGATDAVPSLLEALGLATPAEGYAAWRAWLAAQPAPSLPFTGLLLASSPRGLRATYVQAESGAAKASLLEGDVLVAVEGVLVRSEEDLNEVLALRSAGQEVELELLRGEQPLRIRLTLGARPPGPIGPLREKAPYLGLAVEERDAAVAVRSVDPGSPAAKAGLQPGDLLVSLADQEVASVRSWLRALRQLQAGDRARLTVTRAGQRLTLEVELGPLGD